MERFQKVLDALQRESRELITAAQDAMMQTLLHDDVEPARIALILAQRFTEERIASSFPVVCLLDAMLKESKNPGKDPKRRAFFIAISQEFFKLAPSLFLHFRTSPQASSVLRDKVLRVLKRWAQAQLLSAGQVGPLTRAVELGAPLSQDSGVKNEGTAADVKATHTGKANLDSSRITNSDPVNASDQRISNSDEAGMRKVLTHVQAQSFRSVLHQCVAIIEQLPLKDAQPYVELIRSENFHHPTMAALAFSKDLLAQLQRGSCLAKDHQGTVGTMVGAPSSSTAAPGKSAASDAARQDARTALSQLLHAMPSSTVREGAEDGLGPMSSTSTMVTRYRSPLLMDIFQQCSHAERTGFGEFRRRQQSSRALAASKMANYPRKEVSTCRPFRIPSALQAGGGAIQCWFPSPSQWVNEKDVANILTFYGRDSNLPKLDETTSIGGVPRKRERSE
ncbi:unnamed protein product [Phytomonas sp. Hart1]|nr:unnamed protein product [Phytomonas sp. Hart1]|eukprot:CCW71800.1 unnamed protein product [Phytomonas sp. isolate Hart1]